MKRAVFGICVAAVAAFVLWGSGITAANRSFDERFLTNGLRVETGESGTYNFDKAHSFIGFLVKHNGLVTVPGFFRDFVGMVNYDAKDVSKSSVTFTAKATSVDTGVAGRDNHLRTADFFEVEKFPEITFKSTKVEKKGDNWIVTGDFTLKGVTKSISFPFNIAGFVAGGERSGPRMGVTGETKLNRRDYGVNYGGNLPGTSIPLLSDEVTIFVQVEAVQPKASAAE
ncbi:MAG: YceI family protein [Pyrinomonadaceae bacterium]